jgi:Nuclease-related domain
MFISLLYTFLSYVPLGILFVALKWSDSREKSRGRRAQAPEKMLRPPGESLRKQAESLDRQIADQLIWLLGFPVLVLIIYLAARESAPPAFTLAWRIVLAVSLDAYALMAVGLVRRRRGHEKLRLGYHGERAVGEELNRLMLDGCRVFHDVPLSKDWNLDHVVVAPSGVYAIETKTQARRKSGESQAADEVVYDGICLQFPNNAYDSKSPAQAYDHAERLAHMLSEDLNATVHVKPILTLPGWWIACKGKGEVAVMNPQMIRSAIVTDNAPVLSPELIEDITRHLDKKCRDVEF